MYVAAHPDDENTRALAWFSLGEKAETAYFSLTRGDGGQNLIGDELSEKLGVLRTQELLAARSYDGAKQYFSRAVDFGYSKSPEESFQKWGRDALLEDLVLMIRMFQPDVIVTRFPPDERAGHGHHTASAELAIEAFEKAADKSIFPEQLQDYDVWQTTSIYWNTSYWWDKDIREYAVDNPDYLIEDIGGYNPLLGMSYNEIGTIARSQHKCQGFGAIIERGEREEYFQHLAGKKLNNSFFEESSRSWSDMSKADLDTKFEALLSNFDFENTANNIPALLEIYKELKSLPDSYLKSEKIERCQEIIADCLGLRAELKSDDYSYVAGTIVDMKLELLNRSSVPVRVVSFNSDKTKGEVIDADLEQNKVFEYELKVASSNDLGSPFWLNQPFAEVFDVSNVDGRLRAEGDASMRGSISMQIDGTSFELPVSAIYKWRDPSYGERSRPMIGTPQFTASFEQKIVLLKPGETQEVRVKVHSFQDNLEGSITWGELSGWEVEEKSIPFNIEKKHGEVWLSFHIKATAKDAERSKLVLKDGNGAELYQYTEIAYDHIPTQTIFSPSTLECVVMDAKIRQGKIAYINGVEDGLPAAIATLGFEVESFEVSDLAELDLSGYQSVVLGIRIYNVHPELRNYEQKLYDYVFEGGNLVMQYNTASRSGNNEFGPKPFKLSRNRVTEEDAEVTLLDPKHPILSYPNEITQDDFENWVQERGLYFAGEWDESYTPLFSWADQGEDPVLGGLIVTEHGKGQFVYTGISFFRELPKGVVGAYRLFANLLSYKP
ncbi:MAG: PIG-L family deacetylase [Crocinitomicaceae bacterium]